MHNKTIFLGLIALIILAAGWWGWYSVYVIGNEISEKEAQLEKLDGKFEEIAQITESYDVIKERFDKIESDFDTLRNVVSNRDSFVTVLEEIRRIAETQNVKVITLSPLLDDTFPAIKTNLNFTEKHIERYPIQMRIMGDYLTLGKFLEEVTAIPATVNIARVSLDTDLNEGGILACELMLYTYVFLDDVKI
ncbi:MAG: type 4a pilus biogenesis protein PilO [Fidelibacterota bacterium]